MHKMATSDDSKMDYKSQNFSWEGGQGSRVCLLTLLNASHPTFTGLTIPHTICWLRLCTYIIGFEQLESLFKFRIGVE